MFEALVAGSTTRIRAVVFEHKLLYGSAKGSDINFDGDLARIWRERQYAAGTTARWSASAAMLDVALAACKELGVASIFQSVRFEPVAAFTDNRIGTKDGTLVRGAGKHRHRRARRPDYFHGMQGVLFLFEKGARSCERARRAGAVRLRTGGAVQAPTKTG